MATASPVSRARAAWPVLKAVGASVRLKQTGRVYAGLCPFHGDAHRPSLIVFPATDTWKCFTCGAGGDGLDFLVRQTGQPLRALLHTTLDTAPVLRPVPVPAPSPVAALATRDRIYRRLIASWDLSGAHAAQLHARGLDPAQARRWGWRSLVPGAAPFAVPSGVPGFYRAGGRWRLAGPGGLALPVQDAQGRVQALHVRADAGPGKYVWWSTPGRPGGASSGAPVHVAGRAAPRTTVWITEGPLKATVAADRLGVPVIGVPGATLWTHALPVLANLGPTTVVLAFDQDADPTTAAAIAAAQSACAAAVQAAGYAVRVATWSPAFKGLDDALLAAATVQTEVWPGE